MLKTVLLLLAASCCLAAVERCKEVRPTMMTCREGTGDDLPKTKQGKIEWLVFTRCTLPTVKKSYLDNFPALTDFHASQSSIRTIEGNAFKSNALLDWVDVSENQLTNIPVDLFAELRKIHHVNISHNSLVIPENRPFLNAQHLKWLDMEKSKISILYDSTFRGVPNLEVLSLRGNLLTALPGGLFENLKKLTSLRLDGNKFKTVPGSVFKPLKTLVVYLGDNPWQCDCALYPTIQWSKRNLVKDVAQCTKPHTKTWKEISTMDCPVEPIK